MLQVTAQSKIFLAVQPADFRSGIDGLAALCGKCLERDPFSGCLFVFRNRKGTAIKILAYDGQGFWLCQKRFSEGKLHWWPKANSPIYPLAASQLQILLWNGNPAGAQIPADWRKVE